jgi:uncharacterized membrane protein YdjX (TVP38/TMEM64 family)
MSSPEPIIESAPAVALPKVKTTALLAKAVLLLLLAVVGAVLYRVTPLKEWLAPAGRGAEWFRGLGAYGVVLFGLSSSGLILLGVPRLLLCPLAGALYGFWAGLSISLVATMISYYIGFLWIRGRAHHGIDRAALPKRLAFLAGDPGFTGVVLGRLVPVPGMLVTMALAVSNVSDWAYILGSGIGLIPEAVPAVLLGIMQDDFRKWGRMAVIAMLCTVGAWLVLHYLVKRSGKKRV